MSPPDIPNLHFVVHVLTIGCLFFLGDSDISNCEVVTAWAAGCSWSEALQISGSPPGDLARVLSRALDAVRQFGNLPFAPVRRKDFEGTAQAETVSRGLDPEIRRLCREASRALNRYPVKDPLAFATPEEEGDDDDDSILEDGVDDLIAGSDV